jgi:hypothetical protein
MKRSTKELAPRSRQAADIATVYCDEKTPEKGAVESLALRCAGPFHRYPRWELPNPKGRDVYDNWVVPEESLTVEERQYLAEKLHGIAVNAINYIAVLTKTSGPDVLMHFVDQITKV